MMKMRRTQGRHATSARSSAWLLLAVAVLAAADGCAPSGPVSASPPPGGTAPPPSTAALPTPAASAVPPRAGSVALVGRILTMDQPAVAEALLIEDGAVTAVGTQV
jgi:hypothetical protein